MNAEKYQKLFSQIEEFQSRISELEEENATLKYLMDKWESEREELLQKIYDYESGASTPAVDIKPNPKVKQEVEIPEVKTDGSSIEKAILKALKDLAIKSGAGMGQLVEDVRKRVKDMLGQVSKKEFDKVALKLSGERKIILHSHDLPSNMTKEQLDDCVENNGRYYHLIALSRSYSD